MRVLIVGGGLTGSALAEMLLGEGHQVTLVEQRQDVMERLQRLIPRAHLVLGDGCEPSVLEQTGVRRADVVAAVTGHDEDNLVVCLLAKQEFGVRRTLGRVNNPKNEWLFTGDMGVDERVSQAHIMASLLREEMANAETAVLLRLQRGDTSLVEDMVAPGSPAAGHAIAGLALPRNAVLVAILRGDEIVIPRGDVTLQAGDRILALTKAEESGALAAIFHG